MCHIVVLLQPHIDSFEPLVEVEFVVEIHVIVVVVFVVIGGECRGI